MTPISTRQLDCTCSVSITESHPEWSSWCGNPNFRGVDAYGNHESCRNFPSETIVILKEADQTDICTEFFSGYKKEHSDHYIFKQDCNPEVVTTCEAIRSE